ncbi:MAG: hypothetical protein AAFQ94_30600 [Bacteroidota bacterium]
MKKEKNLYDLSVFEFDKSGKIKAGQSSVGSSQPGTAANVRIRGVGFINS